MTKSSLTNTTCISPNTSGYRGAPSKITIHHTAGVISAEGLGSIFADPGRQASCNYGIGNNGRIICILEEEYHPWTSSNYDNDHAAVTLEVSNSEYGDPWPVGSAAWNSMIRLCADVCSRWGIDPAYDGSIWATYTEHRMFAGTACPGEYIHNRLNMIIAEVKAAMHEGNGEWIKDDKGWWYRYPDGSWPAAKWEYINGLWYFFGSDGYMATGWILWNGMWYYCQPKTEKTGDSYGQMLTGWQRIVYKNKESWFWFADSGELAQDCFKPINGKWYAFDADGRMVEDAKSITIDKNGVVKIA
jgi:hypothetical protein